MAVVYKRLALCEIVETDGGQIVTLKIEKPISLDPQVPLLDDPLYEDHLYQQLDELREKENYVDYHHFCMHLIGEYVILRQWKK